MAAASLSSLVSKVSILLCIAGFDGKFKRLNPAWQRALGWTLEELQTCPFLDLVHPDDRPATLAEMEKLGINHAAELYPRAASHPTGGRCRRLKAGTPWTSPKSDPRFSV